MRRQRFDSVLQFVAECRGAAVASEPFIDRDPQVQPRAGAGHEMRRPGEGATAIRPHHHNVNQQIGPFKSIDQGLRTRRDIINVVQRDGEIGIEDPNDA